VIKSRRIKGGVCGTQSTYVAHIFSVGKPEGKRSIGRPIRRWENILIEKPAVSVKGLTSLEWFRKHASLNQTSSL
jgi:hypothetical protein